MTRKAELLHSNEQSLTSGRSCHYLGVHYTGVFGGTICLKRNLRVRVLSFHCFTFSGNAWCFLRLGFGWVCLVVFVVCCLHGIPFCQLV